MKMATAFIMAALTLAGTAAPARSAEPPVSGVMESFRLAPSTRARPDIAWTDQEGAPFDLSNFQGKVVLVNFWASWCAPCATELPSIERLQKALAGTNFAVVAISVDQTGAPLARRLLRKLGVKNLEIYLDRSGRASRDFGVGAVPTSFLFDREGREVGKIEGPADWSSADAVALVRYFIDNPGYAESLPLRTSSN